MTSKREIVWATAFKRDYKRLSASPRHSKDPDDLLIDALNALVLDRELPVKNRDHALAGEWRG